MTIDIDIYRAAQVLIDQHGDDAAFVAAQRADKLLDTGDLEGVAVWKRILSAIDLLQLQTAPSGQPLN